jgi:adenylosuccinate lyase
MMIPFTHDTFLSPFTWRYGSDEMRKIWSEVHKRRLWRRIWVALAAAEAQAGLVRHEQVEDLHKHEDEIDLERAHEIEHLIRHDLMAEVKTFAEQCPIGGGIIHLGATSMDIEDNAEVLRMRAGLDVILQRLQTVLEQCATLIEQEADHVCMAFTHLQPAEPTTVGYRLAGYAQDLLSDYQNILALRNTLKGKGFKGAVGTAASYHELLKESSLSPAELEAHIMQALELDAFPIAVQTYTRRQDWEVVNALATLGLTLYRWAFDLRLLQSPSLGEWAEAFATHQVGSSAMPFKRNPINAENIDSLARYLAALPRVLWDNAAHNLLERTLDDSANRRIVLPEAFLCAEEILMRTSHILKGLRIDSGAIRANLQRYGTFAATERVLMECGRRGGDRQVLHEIIRGHSLTAWEYIQRGETNPLIKLLSEDNQITQWIDAGQVTTLLNAEEYVGDAPQRARHLAHTIRAVLTPD